MNDNLSPMEIIKKLRYRTNNIRNVCVLAHVDHGINITNKR
jgi:translation elongation factor EF-4